MAKRIIPLTVENEYVQGAGVEIGASGSHDDVILRITFGDAWDGLTKSIIWKDSYGENPKTTLLTVDMLVTGTTDVYDVLVPAAPKAYPGDMYMIFKGVTVSGTLEETATLTAFATFRVLKSMYAIGQSEDVDATVAEQLQAQIDDVIEDVANLQEHAADAEAWANETRDGEPLEPSDPVYHKSARYWAGQSEGFVDQAQGYKDQAQAQAEASAASALESKHYAEEAVKKSFAGGLEVPASDGSGSIILRFTYTPEGHIQYHIFNNVE